MVYYYRVPPGRPVDAASPPPPPSGTAAVVALSAMLSPPSTAGGESSALPSSAMAVVHPGGAPGTETYRTSYGAFSPSPAVSSAFEYSSCVRDETGSRLDPQRFVRAFLEAVARENLAFPNPFAVPSHGGFHSHGSGRPTGGVGRMLMGNHVGPFSASESEATSSSATCSRKSEATSASFSRPSGSNLTECNVNGRSSISEEQYYAHSGGHDAATPTPSIAHHFSWQSRLTYSKPPQGFEADCGQSSDSSACTQPSVNASSPLSGSMPSDPSSSEGAGGHLVSRLSTTTADASRSSSMNSHTSIAPQFAGAPHACGPRGTTVIEPSCSTRPSVHEHFSQSSEPSLTIMEQPSSHGQESSTCFSNRGWEPRQGDSDAVDPWRLEMQSEACNASSAFGPESTSSKRDYYFELGNRTRQAQGPHNRHGCPLNDDETSASQDHSGSSEHASCSTNGPGATEMNSGREDNVLPSATRDEIRAGVFFQNPDVAVPGVRVPVAALHSSGFEEISSSEGEEEQEVEEQYQEGVMDTARGAPASDSNPPAFYSASSSGTTWRRSEPQAEKDFINAFSMQRIHPSQSQTSGTGCFVASVPNSAQGNASSAFLVSKHLAPQHNIPTGAGQRFVAEPRILTPSPSPLPYHSPPPPWSRNLGAPHSSSSVSPSVLTFQHPVHSVDELPPELRHDRFSTLNTSSSGNFSFSGGPLSTDAEPAGPHPRAHKESTVQHHAVRPSTGQRLPQSWNRSATQTGWPESSAPPPSGSTSPAVMGESSNSLSSSSSSSSTNNAWEPHVSQPVYGGGGGRGTSSGGSQATSPHSWKDVYSIFRPEAESVQPGAALDSLAHRPLYSDSHPDRGCSTLSSMTPLPFQSSVVSVQQMVPPVPRRLKLVLDLDNTLLHASAQAKLDGAELNLSDFLSPSNEPELYKFSLPRIPDQVYYVKLRPGIRRFLKELSKVCDLAIHTNATHEYADVVVAILDPDHSLFCGRVAARDDQTSIDHKKNMDRLFRMHDLDPRGLLILDDRKDVWDDVYHPNIIHCGMYDYLKSRKEGLVTKYILNRRSADTAITTSSILSAMNALAGRSQETENSDALVLAAGQPSAPADLGMTPSHPGDGVSEAEQSSPVIPNPVEESADPLHAKGTEESDTNAAVDVHTPFLDNPLVEHPNLSTALGDPLDNLDEESEEAEVIVATEDDEDDDVISPDSLSDDETERVSPGTLAPKDDSASVTADGAITDVSSLPRASEDAVVDLCSTESEPPQTQTRHDTQHQTPPILTSPDTPDQKDVQTDTVRASDSDNAGAQYKAATGENGGTEAEHSRDVEPEGTEGHAVSTVPGSHLPVKGTSENMLLALELPSYEEALIDYDMQLDCLLNLIYEIAVEYNTWTPADRKTDGAVASAPVVRHRSEKEEEEQVEEPDVAKMLMKRRRQILQGVVAQTAGMYKSTSSHPEFGWHDNEPMHRRRLLNLGARVVDAPVPELTHIVAMRATQTLDRVRRERGQEVSYVHALWLHACEARWSRVPEDWFPAMPLLRSYQNKPPEKPWIDHWRVSVLNNSETHPRLRAAMEAWKLSYSVEPANTMRVLVENGDSQTNVSPGPVGNSDDNRETHLEHRENGVPVEPDAGSCVPQGFSVLQTPLGKDPKVWNSITKHGGGGDHGSLSGSTLIASGSTKERIHFVLAPQSSGAEVWSPEERIILSYDPVKSAYLKMLLHERTGQQQPSSEMQPTRNGLENAPSDGGSLVGIIGEKGGLLPTVGGRGGEWNHGSESFSARQRLSVGAEMSNLAGLSSYAPEAPHRNRAHRNTSRGSFAAMNRRRGPYMNGVGPSAVLAASDTVDTPNTAFGLTASNFSGSAGGGCGTHGLVVSHPRGSSSLFSRPPPPVPPAPSFFLKKRKRARPGQNSLAESLGATKHRLHHFPSGTATSGAGGYHHGHHHHHHHHQPYVKSNAHHPGGEKPFRQGPRVERETSGISSARNC